MKECDAAPNCTWWQQKGKRSRCVATGNAAAATTGPLTDAAEILFKTKTHTGIDFIYKKLAELLAPLANKLITSGFAILKEFNGQNYDASHNQWKAIRSAIAEINRERKKKKLKNVVSASRPVKNVSNAKSLMQQLLKALSKGAKPDTLKDIIRKHAKAMDDEKKKKQESSSATSNSSPPIKASGSTLIDVFLGTKRKMLEDDKRRLRVEESMIGINAAFCALACSIRRSQFTRLRITGF